MSIYKKMEDDWKTYCLMSGIAFIEEFSKPYETTKTVRYNNKKTVYKSLRSIRLKVKSKEIINLWWEITRKWEKETKLDLLGGKSKKGPIKENYSGQYQLFFTPIWLFKIFETVGKLPSEHSNKYCLDKIKVMTERKSGRPLKYLISKDNFQETLKKPSQFNILLRDKNLAKGAFIVSFDLEFKGIESGSPCLCMTTRYEDFLQFMLDVAKKWKWNTSNKLVKVDLEHSFKRGINASPKKEFRLSIKSLQDIYSAGSLADSKKDKYLKFQIKRSSNNSTKNVRLAGETKNIILNELSAYPKISTEIMIPAGVRRDVVLDHLRNLEREGLVYKERAGKAYNWFKK